jgi:tripartite-type tricarboxylate transporter receptor subunit TctC
MRSLFAGIAIAAASATAIAAESPYPNKPIRVVIAQLPGGTADTVLRMYAEKMGETLGQRLIVDNRAGSGVAGLTALQLVANANPDGYTLLLVVPNFTFAPALVKDMPVDAVRDFAPVTLLNRDPYLITMYPGLPATSVKDLVAYAKAKPGTLNAGAGNFGSGTHLVTMYFLNAAGIRDVSTYVPYKGMSGAFIDAMAGRLHVAVSSIVSGWPHVKAGRLRALTVTGAKRSDALPDTPTAAEQGMRGFEASAWNGLVAPAKTPPALIQKLSSVAAQAAKAPDIREKLKSQGSEAIGSTPAEFRQLIATEIPRWRALVKELGLTATAN